MSTYSKADTTAQWFQDNFPGAVLNLTPDTMVLVLHTTESTGWPGYQGGATAPNDTARPNMRAKRLEWRAHFPDERSSRALRNTAGGMETNTLNALQVELVGTCDPAHRERWGSARAGVDYIYWPDAPTWALQGLADFVADLHRRHGLRLEAPRFDAYPTSIRSVRMSMAQWRRFAGVCGHQHVPENVHGDPGDLDVQRVLQMARAKVTPAKAPVKAPAAKAVPKPPTRVTTARVQGRELLATLDAAVAAGRTGAVKAVRDEIRRQLAKLPAR